VSGTSPSPPGRRRTFALGLTIVLALASSVAVARGLDARRPALRAALQDEPPYLAPAATRRLVAGFGGPVADWYWLTALQYVGRKIEETAGDAAGTPRAVELDRIDALNPRVLVPLLELITTLDPRFTAVYEYAAVVLPAVDVAAAIALLEHGIQANPDQWYLHQQLAYIYWQRGDFLLAADAFRRGARMTTAKWMDHMAERMEGRGDDPQTAYAMYTRMHEQAQDEQVRQWALKRLMGLRSLQEREAIRGVLTDFVTSTGRCPQTWTDVTARLQAAGLTVHPQGPPVDPSGTPYVLVISPLGCDVALHRSSTVPRG
jgi:tetratricopeptide (TPR) repeat protein